MKNRNLTGALLSACLLTAASTTYAQDITGVLENPPVVGSPVAGIGLVSGYAFAEDEGEDLTIYLRVDGVTLRDFEIPCCGERKDVDDNVPGAPDETGFGLLVNFSDLSPGPHIIGVDIRSSDVADDLLGDEDRLIIERQVFVTRPGNVSFVSAVNLSNATCSIAAADNEIVLNNVGLTSAGGSSTTNLRAAFVPANQSFVLTESSDALALNSFVAHLNGSQEVPRVQTSGTGEATATLNADNSLTCLLNTNNLVDATAAHIHIGAFGVNGPIILTLTGGPPNWTCPSTPLTADQVTALRNGQLYFNVHTPDRPDGKARGQIVAAPVS